MTLQELTSQESGIVVYDNTVFVVNWSSYMDDTLPVLSPFGEPMEWQHESIEPTECGETNDIMNLLPDEDDMDIAYDYNDDIAMLLSDDEPTAGRWYQFEDCIVIAPEGWI